MLMLMLMVANRQTSEGPAGASAAALAAVSWAETVVLCVGNDHSIEHEGIDRKSFALSPVQEAFALSVLRSGKPVVLVLINGGAVSIDSLIQNSSAIVEAFYPNQAGAAAIGAG